MPDIVLMLARALHALLQEELRQQALQHRRFARGRIEERLALGVILKLSRSRIFRDRLLFRDYDQEWSALWQTPGDRDDAQGECRDADDKPEPREASRPGADQAGRVYRPACIYVSLVLCRQLTLANNLKDRPTSMHRLLKLLVAHGPAAQGWPQVRIARMREAPPRNGPPAWPSWFAPVARALEAQVRHLDLRYGSISANRVAEYGPYWLNIPGADLDPAKVAEDLTLWDCVKALAVPLERDLDEPSFEALADVLASLNRRYAQLRSCGLDPEHWFEDETLSDARLDDLIGLRRAVAAHLAGTGAVREDRVEEAYERAFAELKGPAAKFAGFTSFTPVGKDDEGAFLLSPVGQQMIYGGLRSLDVPVSEADAGPSLVEVIDPDPLFGSARPTPETETIRESDLPLALRACPGLRSNPTLAWFAEQTLLARRTIWGPGGVLEDLEFRRLVDASARYPATDDQALVDAIARDLDEAIRYYAKQAAAKTRAAA